MGIKYIEAIIKYFINRFVGLKPPPERDKMAPKLSIKNKSFSTPIIFLKFQFIENKYNSIGAIIKKKTVRFDPPLVSSSYELYQRLWKAQSKTTDTKK